MGGSLYRFHVLNYQAMFSVVMCSATIVSLRICDNFGKRRKLTNNVKTHFLLTHRRHETGRYCVRLPFRPKLVGSADIDITRPVAVQCLRQMARKFISNDELRTFISSIYGRPFSTRTYEADLRRVPN